MGKHQKHAKLKLRNNDIYAPNEIAVLGTKCNIISKLVQQVSDELSSYKLAYFDASHNKNVTKNTLETFTFHSSGSLQSNSNFDINKFNIKYPILLAQFGSSNKVDAQKKIPSLKHIVSYPTLIFIDRKKNIRSIHTGFNGPATVEKYNNFKKYFEELIMKLINES